LPQQVLFESEKRSPIRPRAKFTTWLLKLRVISFFNEMRRHKRHSHVPLQPNGRRGSTFEDEMNLAPDAVGFRNGTSAEIEDAILQLPETQRMGCAAQV